MAEASVLWLSGDTAGIGPLRADLKESYWQRENTIPTAVGYNRQTLQPFEVCRLFYDSYENSSDR